MKTVIASVGVALASYVSCAHAEVQDCIEIVSLPAVITQQGIHCMKKDLATSATTGNAITINANNVTIEMNGYKLGGLGGGVNTQATGISAYNRQNITIRNGAIRGFLHNVKIEGPQIGGSSTGHLIENVRSESARYVGLWIMGSHSVVKNNTVILTGGGTLASAYGIVVQFGEGHSVMNNIVNDVSESNLAYGITASDTIGAVVEGNQVRDVAASTSYGIFSSGERNVIQRNTIINFSAGTTGIDGQATNDACIGNAITNFTAPLNGCSLSSGNLTF
ncbi:hypothetical protein [Mesorhizobium australicum]|nr:hypothetical protein [Mesorhizobium australicum]